ncbi:hypothetical protein HS088_TW21G01717 [Tripterygium wilfordii]|uniref:FKBP-type peptidyl-prolyl cis-trans isomerase n=1 Tax=Tripterygium wilfordii TaxID=458696 RepID=A0A7J7C5U9_TRIWF|nr:uncharacterized protein LOC119989116 [Tripterygium wilfordii]KAF5729550.1 hypothetical protein HS088_TW21G01717 [Tripterygium wilfordii]
MAILPSSLQLSIPFPSPCSSRHALTFKRKTTPLPTFTVRAATDEDPQSPSKSEPESSDPFEERLSEVRLRYRSGTGKKAELRKARKGSSRSSSKVGMYLPPVALAEAESDGLKVEFGFSPYSERVNGRIAILGLTALLLVELATGKSVINYHTPGIVLIQVYFVAAVTAMYCKYDKEKMSVWPQSSE